MDNEGNVVISPALGYREIYEFVDGVAIGFRLDHKPDEGGWGLLNERGEKITDFKYWHIERFVERNLYIACVTPGLRKNLMRNDGTLVFKESYQDIYKNSYKGGYVIASNTIRKTSAAPNRYPKGLLHTKGEVLLPVEYDDIQWVKGREDILCIKREGYIGYVCALYNGQTGIELDVTLPGLWMGVKGTVCEGCIYSKCIDSEGKGCGKLFLRSFRDRNLSGECEYRKRSLTEPSLFGNCHRTTRAT
ncbi:MAG: WG repeat-containing protein [Bacteroidales bacterium]|nr:WG repeat-containing protein [Bacteroidales bacterium]